MKILPLALFLCVAAHNCLGAASSETEFDVLDVMLDELSRSFDVLQDEDEPPYFLSYEITQDKIRSVSGSYGEIGGIVDRSFRELDIDLRVGSSELDNTHFGGRGGATSISIESPEAIRNTLWYATNREYRIAIAQLSDVRSAMQSRVEEIDQSGDFSPAPREEYRTDVIELEAALSVLQEKVRLYGAPFKRAEHIIFNRVTVSGDVETRWFVNSEGTKIRVSQPFYRVTIEASSKADDGMVLSRQLSHISTSLDGLPDDESILNEAETLIEELAEMRDAPIVEPYAGPAILSGRATGVFFHEILGHRLEGHRQKAEHEGQTFKSKLGEYVLPENFSVVFDPNVRKFGTIDLAGSYDFDNQGVRAQRVTVVRDGILEGFLTSRLPMEGFPISNGHGRKNQGRPVVARQSNMFVEVENPYSPEQLKAMLIERVLEQGKEFGLYFEDIRGGFTVTQRTMPNAFNVTPVVVYRIFTDGHQEMVRGVDLIGTPLTTFSRVEAGASDFEVFNGVCGAESGLVPVAAVAPSILVSQIEVQKKASSRSIPPILPNPVDAQEGLSSNTPTLLRR
ncbi:MAG: TldD/PmbA family protein [Gammaproteobacteria bacterium]|nr:TldD/PmbA family protein [Gammaproteobacteria bacterium]